ncbi:LamG domain-containing protein [Aeromonas rivipollensis]|uniref:LamG domain-containing protein n=1 Tax=Aeromonas rivipollensis TaxID=948519 RepID=UPI003D223369
MADPLQSKVVLFCAFNKPSPSPGALVLPFIFNEVTNIPLTSIGNTTAGFDTTYKKNGSSGLACEFPNNTRLVESNNLLHAITPANPKMTVEFWVYRKTASANLMMGKSGRANISYTNWFMLLYNTGVIYMGFGISGTIGSSLGGVSSAAGVVPVGVWVHIAMVFDTRVATLYVNGSQVSTHTTAQTPQDNNPASFYIGTEWDQPSQSSAGCVIDDLRITNDVRYTANFTPEDYSADYPPHSGAAEGKTVKITAIPANQEPRSQFKPQDVVWRGSPGAVYAGPMPAVAVTADPLCRGQDMAWVRDGNQNVQQGYIESTVTIDGEGVRRRVLCFDQAGNLIGETYSRASDGKYRFDLLWLNRRYMLVAQDDPAFGPADYNAVAADYQLPTPYAPGEGVGLSGG